MICEGCVTNCRVMPFGSHDSLNAARSGIPHLKPRSLVTSECVHRWIAAWSTVIEAWGAEPGGKGSPSMFQHSVWPWAPGDQKNKIPDKKQTQLAPSVRWRGSASQMRSSEIKELSPSRAAASSSSCQMSQLRWLGHLIRVLPRRLALGIFWACPTGRTP